MPGMTDKIPARADTLLGVIEAVALELRPGRGLKATLTLDSALDHDLGFDSLSRMEVIARVEKTFQIILPDQVFANADTPRDLLQAVIEAGGTAVAGPEASDGRIGNAPDQSVNIQKAETVGVPINAKTLVEVLEWHVRVHPDRPHVQFYSDQGGGDVVTYGALRDEAKGIAAGLQGLGLQAGEAVAIMLPTGRDYLISFFGILMAGGVPVPNYPPARMAQIEEHLLRHSKIIDNCQAGILIAMPEAVAVGRILKAQVMSLRHVTTVAALQSNTDRAHLPVLNSADTAFVQYTSGSTGNPKGVVLTHANLLANIRVMGAALKATPEDVFVSWLPLYHDMGLIGAWLGSLYFGNLLVLMSPLKFLARPERWLRAISDYGGTISAAPNFAYELCLRRIDDEVLGTLDLSSWRAALNGAEAVMPETVTDFNTRFAPSGFSATTMLPVYGLAESTVGLAFPPQGQPLRIDTVERDALMDRGDAVPMPEGQTDDGHDDSRTLRFVACGRALPGHQIRIVDKDGFDLPDRKQGRLQFCGPSSTSGYLRNPEQTASLFDGPWLDSGDLAYLVDGDLFVTGRIKDLIIYAGRNIYPVEIEAVISDIEGVRRGNVAVFGSKDKVSRTERLIVLAETRRNDEASQTRIRREINQRVIDLIDMPPDEIALTPPRTVLKTSSGKIRRSACRDMFERGQIGKSRSAVWMQLIRLSLSSIAPLVRRMVRRAGELAFAAWSWTVLVVLVPILWLIVAVVPGHGFRWGVVRFFLKLFQYATATRIDLQGCENLPPSDQPCVYVCNHTSYLDPLALMAVWPRRFGFVAKAELTGNWIMRIFLSRIGAEFVERFDADKAISDVRRVAAAAEAGRSVFFFPEGTFIATPGLLSFRMGAFVAAAEAGVPVVPVTIRGMRHIFRGDTFFPRHGAVTIVIGEAIGPSSDARTAGEWADGGWAAAIQMRDGARAEILSQCGEPDLPDVDAVAKLNSSHGAT